MTPRQRSIALDVFLIGGFLLSAVWVAYTYEHPKPPQEQRWECVNQDDCLRRDIRDVI